MRGGFKRVTLVNLHEETEGEESRVRGSFKVFGGNMVSPNESVEKTRLARANRE